MGWFGDKQPPSVRLGSRAYRRNGVLYQGDERKRMKGSLSYLADDKKNDNTHTSRVRPTRVRAHTPDKFVWKVTEVSHCRYTARCCHSVVSHQRITQTNACLHARALVHTAEAHTLLYRADKKKKTNFNAQQRVTKPPVFQQNKLPF